jgi:hypothetical protein
MVLGVNLLSDAETLKMWYAVDYDEVRLRSNFNLGVQIAWPEYVITNGLS